MGTVEIRPAPHVRGERTVEKIMLNVVWSLLPICAFYIFQYGVSALASITVVTGACQGPLQWTFPRTANGSQQSSAADLEAFGAGLGLVEFSVHALGLDEVARLHGELRALMQKVDFTGDKPGCALLRFLGRLEPFKADIGTGEVDRLLTLAALGFGNWRSGRHVFTHSLNSSSALEC